MALGSTANDQDADRYERTHDIPETAVCEWYDMVKKFHIAFGHPAPDDISEMRIDDRKYRAIWMVEEVVEFTTAKKLVDQVDSMVDLIVFALGTLVEMGVDPQEIFDEVHRANMSKLWPDGKPRYRDDNKLMKPNGWEPPQKYISKILKARINARFDEIEAQREKDGIPF